jgi:hypothetical protein
MATTTVSLAAIRRLAVSSEAYAPRFCRARAGEVEDAIRRLGAVQLDSISAVDRAHRLPIELWPHFRRTMESAAHWRYHEQAMLRHGDLTAKLERAAARLARVLGLAEVRYA